MMWQKYSRSYQRKDRLLFDALVLLMYLLEIIDIMFTLRLKYIICVFILDRQNRNSMEQLESKLCEEVCHGLFL